MIETEQKGMSDNKIVHNHYLLISDEPLLINNMINEIKHLLKINESFDYETFSMEDYEYSDIINKVLTPPFMSQKRMLVVRNIERKNLSDLQEFARMLGRVPSSCCLVMVYQIEKRYSKKRVNENYKKIGGLFSDIHCVTLIPDETTISKWVTKKIEAIGLKGRPEIINYLKETFSDDITGMKNEIQKIENYLYEVKQLGLQDAKDITYSLPEYDVYYVANNFFQHRSDTLKQFLGLKLHLRSPMILIDALGRLLHNYAKNIKNEKLIRYWVAELSLMDNRLKNGSDLVDLLMEVFFIKNLGVTTKGATYGK